MAYVVWRVLMKKYSKVRLGLQKGSTYTHTASNTASSTWVSNSQFYSIEGIENHCRTITSESDNESTYTNLSKMRSYLKRCESAISSISLSGKRSTKNMSSNSIRIKQSTSSWYIENIDGPGTENPNKHFSELDCIGNEMMSSAAEIAQQLENPTNNGNAECFDVHNPKNEFLKSTFQPANDEILSDIVDEYLAALYPNYFESTRAVLLRQARDLLETTFHGDLSFFKREFLSPAAELIKIIKNASHNLSKTVCVDGWPLAIHGKVILQLGTLNEAILKPTDLYLCIKSDRNENSHVVLCAVWRSFQTQRVVYQKLNSNIDTLTSIALEMLTEDLPQLLQSLLVSVEQTISRVPFDELAFPKYIDDDEIDNHKVPETAAEPKLDGRPISGTGSPKCGIKRRENITKNKPLQNRYTLRRMSVKADSDNPDKRETDVSTLSSSTSTTSTTINTSNNMMPLFCLGGSFPHIDSDEDSGDDGIKSPNDQASHHHDIVAPRSITDLPEKLLTSGVYLSDTHDINGFPIITIETKILMDSGLNCYEVATLILYYNTIPTNPSKFIFHAIVSESYQLPVLNLLDNAFNLLTGHVHIDYVLVSTLFTSDKLQLQLPSSKIKIVHAIELFDHIPPECAPKICNGTHVHNQALWREFFVTLELLRRQCVSVGQDLVSVMNEIRLTDSLGMPSRRQLYSQHRALSRALMDSELQCLRRKGQITLTRLQSLAKSISSNDKYSTSTESTSFTVEYSNRHVSHRLKEVTAIFGEVDRAARRLEQLTEQRRERLREITRQKALEEEMKEITKWIQNDGESMLKKYADVPLDSETSIKDCEHDFEKFYFISMKYLAKGRDLEEAAMNLESAKELRTELRQHLSQYSDRLEMIRERVEGAVRLHHLLGMEFKEKDVQVEMQKLAEKIGALSLIERYRNVTKDNVNNTKIDKTSTPFKEANDSCSCWPTDARFHNNRDVNKTGIEMMVDEDEDHSKIADSGLGGCDRCEMNDKLVRTCSCQSFDEPTNKSHNSDEMEEDCYDNNMKGGIDYHSMSPLKPNAHLYSYSSNITLPDLENNIGLAPKTQKTLLLIMREMIGTERDYVRSLHYIIDNYMDEMNREDIPQALRGQRNVIFGNVEKICEFHQQYFLHELERCENNPLKIGAVFLEHESKFYLYALYNKNKPKSEALMSEYGSRFFKAKQIELGDKMDLASYLLKPVQRMGKYALLLQQLMKAVTSIQNEGPTAQEINEDIEELQKAEEMVRFQLRHGNDLLAMDSLRDCDVNVKEQGRLLRQNEFLVWQGRGGKKSLRQVFLFEDLVLFSKARRFPDSKNLDIYLYKNSIKTSDIGLTEFVCDSTTKFEIWFRKMKPDDTWTLQSMNEDTKKVWTEEISRLLWKQAKRNREIRMAEMSSMGIGNKPCLDIRPSQNQINDRSVSRSQLEKAPKLRSSFSSSIAESTKVVQRPNSIISLGSSFSSSTSHSSASTSSSSSNTNNRNAVPLGVELDMINETLPLKTVNNSKKYQRSTTLASQLSMESGIIADISTSPDNEVQTAEDAAWMKSLPTFVHQKSQMDNSIPKRQTSNINVTQKMTSDNDMLGANSTTNPYINNDSIAVHL